MKNTVKYNNQISNNIWSIYNFNKAMEEYNKIGGNRGTQLRSCRAHVHETENYYILQSYNTMVACIDKRTKCGYDVLRYEYEYTATSAQHISKFLHDYGAENYRRYYPVK